MPIYNIIKKEKEELILINIGVEASLANKSMINITENIHHELNTPLEVIDNKIEKIHKELSIFLLQEYEIIGNIDTISEDRIYRNKRLLKLNEDFGFIKTSSEQIYAVLEKMKGFKHLRYSNGNKSIKNIIDGGFKIINISNSNFEYKVDNELENYKIGTDKLKNADFLSIILNHLKNSLEAFASKIFILFNKYENDKIYIRIIDNGNGIPEDIQKKIFTPNFSTKNSDSGIRGNGMYLNKHVLSHTGGDINLISSSKKGTTIELEIPAIKK
jgi:signal transduction histidine kinase